MKRVICTAVILLTTASLSYGKCRQEIRAIPDIPNVASATVVDFNRVKSEIRHYSTSAKDFARCTLSENNKRSHKRGDRALWKMKKLTKQYNDAYTRFSQQLSLASNNI